MAVTSRFKSNRSQYVNRSAKTDLPKIKAIAAKPVIAAVKNTAPKPKIKPVKSVIVDISTRAIPVKKTNYQSTMARARAKESGFPPIRKGK